ncbi:MAG TPA: phytoene/squalene synthase family protein [Chthoniobacterales bacterium]|nr:phytoene/squalene synthase family protein [Chthoniobacterales bacterium]
MKTPPDREELRRDVLRAVSRSFYLSLRILPGPLRDPLSLAYLLARATDTLADTPEAPLPVKKQGLADLAAAIQGRNSEKIAGNLAGSFTRLQSNPAERTLIERLPELIQWLDALAEDDRDQVRAVLMKINRGQMLDLERFDSGSGTGTDIKALLTAAELDEYTYLVAGCVGEFWTRICFAHLRGFCDRPEAEMLELGADYGRGLQLVNVLRDAGEDLRNGRCYLPADELDSLGLRPSEILGDPARVDPVMKKWRDKAGQGMAAGIEYAGAIRSRRVRFATALPALIGARTLALLEQARAAGLTTKVKVPRAEVRKMIFSAAVASRGSLQRMFAKLRGA